MACSSFEERHSRTELGYATADIFRENLQLLDAERDCVDTNTLTADNFPSFLDTFACFEHNHAARIYNAVEQPIDHLASAQMSCPLILLSQAVHLHTQFSSSGAPFDAVVGHSQGIAAANVATSHVNMEPDSTIVSTHKYTRCLVWSGLRGQAAITHSVALQLPESCSARSAEQLQPVCMAAVSTTNLFHLLDILDRFNTTMPACLRVGALLQNTEENFVVGGSPVGIVAFRAWLTELEESSQNCELTSHDLIGMAVTVPFHDPTWLGEAALLTTDDMHVRKVCTALAYPSQDNLHTRFLTQGKNSVTSQNSVTEMNAFIRELMYMPVNWPTSLCFAATLLAATCTWEPTTCHLDIYGPRCSKVMLVKALSSTPLLAVAIRFSEGNCIGSEESFRKKRRPQPDMVSAKWLLTLSSAVETITGISSAVTLEKSDAPLISSAGLSSAQALAVAEELLHMFGVNKIPNMLLFDYPTPAEIARFLSTMTSSYHSSLILDIKSISNHENHASE